MRLSAHIAFYTRGYGVYHWVFDPCFLSFLSPYYHSLRYVPGLKTTLRPRYHALCFDSSHVGDTWDWLESILIMIGQELWYDPTLGHSHLREFFLSGMQPFCLIRRIRAHLSWSRVDFLDGHYARAFLSQWWIFESWPPFEGDQMTFFTLEHETWLVYFIWCTLHRGIFLSRWWFLRHSCSLEVIGFLLHWSIRHEWEISFDVLT